MRFWWVILLGTVLSIVFSCNDNGTGARSERLRYTDEDLHSALALLSEKPDDFDLNMKVWGYYTESGQYEALVHHAEPVFRRSYGVRGKERLALASGAFISQAYVLRENLDSVAHYLNRIMPFAESEHSNDFLNALAHNIAALYYLKTELDYSAALEHYGAALAIMEKRGQTANQSTLLGNIASVYYVYLHDSAGFEYARKAYDITHSDESRPYARVFSTIQLAQMYYLKGDLRNALTYAQEASSEAQSFPQVASDLDLLYADIAFDEADYRKAEGYYLKALAGAKDTEPSINALIYLRYGMMLSKLSRYAEAEDMLTRGLEINSRGHRHELLSALSDASLQMGRERDALNYYKEYHNWLDSISYSQRERAFQQYRLLIKDNELQGRELDLLKANRRIVIIVAASVLILIIAIALWVINRRQNRMYRHLVETHQQSLARLSGMRNLTGQDEIGAQEKDNRDLQLWMKLDEMMISKRIYRYSDISLDRIAEMLGTNRVYVSRVINKYSGMSFYNYIHSHRIEDASRILSDTSNDISLKTLAFELGYNSISSFYRAFHKETGVPPSLYREEVLRIKQNPTD
jgi:AraC-like DNA-binding protein